MSDGIRAVPRRPLWRSVRPSRNPSRAFHLDLPTPSASRRHRARGGGVRTEYHRLGFAGARRASLRAEIVEAAEGVVSNKMMKSVTVMVERLYKHPRWGKYVRGRKKYMVRRVTRASASPSPR